MRTSTRTILNNSVSNLFTGSNLVLSFVFAGLCAAGVLAPSSASADKDPDAISETVAIAQKIVETSLELQEVTRETDTISHFALNYAYDPKGTVQALYEKLTAEQKSVGTAIQNTRRRMDAFRHDPEFFAAIQDNLRLLEARYSDIFNEIIETNSKGRLPVSLMGKSKADAEALFARKALLTERLQTLNARLSDSNPGMTSTLPGTCDMLFRSSITLR